MRSSLAFAFLLGPFSFKPSGPRAKHLRKFDPKTTDGIFIGYFVQSGGKWSGDYLVVSKHDFESTDSERDVHIQQVKEVFPPVIRSFPVVSGAFQPRASISKVRQTDYQSL